jgi:hypothetical protein
MPYGDVQLNAVSRVRNDINSDPDVSLVAHAGDIKNGSTLCTDQRFNDTFAEFQALADPFWYTPGDNEWTDCHRANNGSYNPLERLAKIRSLFYPVPGQTTGGTTMAVTSQGLIDPLYPQMIENTMFVKSNVSMGAIHFVSSDNDRIAWSGLTPAQLAAANAANLPITQASEANARQAANLEWIDAIFDDAVNNNRAGAIIMMQAQPVALGAPTDYLAIQNKIKARTIALNKPVLLLHGDEHVGLVTPNYLGVANLTRVENWGAADTPASEPNLALRDGTNKWYKITIDPATIGVFTIESKTVPLSTLVTPVSQTPWILFGGAAIVGAAMLATTQRRRTVLVRS